MASDVPEFCLRWNSHHSTLVSVLDSLLERERLCDVTLAAQGRFINVHRLVLFACSPYFEELLSQQPDKQAVVFLKDVCYTDLKNLVDYMYKGEVNVAQDQLTSFLQTAESLQIKGLVDKEKSKKSPAASLPEKSLNLLRGKTTPNQRAKVPSPVNPATSQATVTKPSAVISSPPTTPPVESQFIQSHNETEEYHEQQQGMEDDNEDNFISVNAKHEDSELGMDDQFEATEHWNEQDEEEDGWSNSHEGMSGTNTSDITIANTSTLAPEHGHMIPDNHADNSTAGPSRSRKAKSSMANSTAARGGTGELEASRPFVCTKCGRSYLNNSNLQRHVLGCSESTCSNSFHVCPLCSFSGSSKWQVKRHIQQVHKIITFHKKVVN